MAFLRSGATLEVERVIDGASFAVHPVHKAGVMVLSKDRLCASVFDMLFNKEELTILHPNGSLVKTIQFESVEIISTKDVLTLR